METIKNQEFGGERPLFASKDLRLENVTFHAGESALKCCENIDIEDYKQQGNYSFQYCKNVEIRNAHIDSKDAFWGTENVTVYDSELTGEYLGWHSKNLRLVRCKISGTQPLCYCENLILEDCSFAPDADLAFEDSTLQATVNGPITSVKNPRSGHLKVESIGELIIDKNILAPANCIIETAK